MNFKLPDFKVSDNMVNIFKVMKELNNDEEEEDHYFNRELETKLNKQNELISRITELLCIKETDDQIIKNYFKKYKKEKIKKDKEQEDLLKFLQYQAYLNNRNRQTKEILNFNNNDNNFENYYNKKINYKDKLLNDLAYK